MNKDLKFSGKITKLLPAVTGTSKTGKEWSKTEIVVTDSAKYPQSAKFELFNKPDVVKFLKEGQDVEVSFNLKTNEWKEKYFVSLSAWRVNIKTETETVPTVEDLPEDNNLPF